MYSGRAKTLQWAFLPHIGFVFGAGVLLLAVVLAGQSAFRMAQRATPGLTHHLSHGADREITSGPSRPAGNGSAAGRVGIGSASLPPPPVIFPAAQASGFAPFTNEAEREEAQNALADLRETVNNLRRFDTAPVVASEGEEPVPAILHRPATDVRPAAPVNAAAQHRRSLQIDSLEGQITLVGHPERFPEAVRDEAAYATQEMRVYLKTMQLADAAVTAEERDALSATARSHLAHSESLLSQLEATAGGSAATRSSIAGLMPNVP